MKSSRSIYHNFFWGSFFRIPYQISGGYWIPVNQNSWNPWVEIAAAGHGISTMIFHVNGGDFLRPTTSFWRTRNGLRATVRVALCLRCCTDGILPKNPDIKLAKTRGITSKHGKITCQKTNRTRDKHNVMERFSRMGQYHDTIWYLWRMNRMSSTSLKIHGTVWTGGIIPSKILF